VGGVLPGQRVKGGTQKGEKTENPYLPRKERSGNLGLSYNRKEPQREIEETVVKTRSANRERGEKDPRGGDPDYGGRPGRAWWGINADRHRETENCGSIRGNANTEMSKKYRKICVCLGFEKQSQSSSALPFSTKKNEENGTKA